MFAVLDTPRPPSRNRRAWGPHPAPLMTLRPGQSGPAIGAPKLLPYGASTSRCRPATEWPRRAPVERGSRRWPPCSSNFLPVRAGSVRLNGRTLELLRLTACGPSSAWWNRRPTCFDTTIAENLRIGRRGDHGRGSPGCTRPGGPSGWLARPSRWAGHRSRTTWHPTLGRTAPADRDRPGPAGRLPDPRARRAHRAPRPLAADALTSDLWAP